jgi:5'-3' exonuclease
MMATATSFKIGQPVRWIPLDAAGRPCAELVTVIRSFENVARPDGSLNACAVLVNNRLASLDRLFAMDAPAIEIEKPVAVAKPTKKPAAAPAKRPATTDELLLENKPLRPAVPIPAAMACFPAIAPCEVLAFDFMNLLVRAWHAGKPTETHAVRSMFQTVANAVRTLRPQRIVFAMDGGHVHRSKLLPQYKAHRPPHDPNLIKQIELASEALRIAGIPAFRVQNWEADDVLASLVERCPAIVICSSDKDLLALHGRCRIFHPWTGGGFVDPESKLGIPAGQVTDFLAMCGDTSDGVPGVKGIGEKTALKLLQDHENLEAILVAAQMNQIPGAIGKHLREQRAAALLCQSVIQLRSSLPLPELLPWDPVPGYQQRLQSIGLGSVAGILDGLRQMFENTESENTPQSESPFLSASTGQEEQNGRDEFLHDQQELQPVQPSRSSPTESRKPLDTVLTAEPGSRSSEKMPAAGSAAIRVTRSITEPIRKNLNMVQRWDGPDKGMISCWESGREASPDRENPWKPETPNWFAWEQGRKWLDLDVFWYPPETEKPPTPKPPRHVPPSKRKSGSLF